VAVIISPYLGVVLGDILNYFQFIFKMPLFDLLHNIPQLLISSFSIALLGLVVSVPSVIIVGIPLYLILNKKNIKKLWVYILIGSVFGIIAPYLYMLILRQSFSAAADSFNLYSTIKYSLYGLSTASVFWFVVVYLPFRKSGCNEP